jgi:hypothetical protein
VGPTKSLRDSEDDGEMMMMMMMMMMMRVLSLVNVPQDAVHALYRISQAEFLLWQERMHLFKLLTS